MPTHRALTDKVEHFPYSSAPGYRLDLARRVESHVGGAAHNALIIVPGTDAYTHYDELVRRTENVRIDLMGHTLGQDWGGGPLVLLWLDRVPNAAVAGVIARATSALIVPWGFAASGRGDLTAAGRFAGDVGDKTSRAET